VVYACDPGWWKHHGEQVVREFHGERWTHRKESNDEEVNEVVARFELQTMLGVHGRGLGRTRMHFGDNSGYQAVNLAYLWGARRILLLGYDMQRTGGKSHWFGDHPQDLNVGSEYEDWRDRFRILARDLEAEGIEVINCTRETALDCFPRMELERAL
jgi:hypothetical protein